uniref:Uncharacterized protein n=1 Tax=Aggregatibacter actinomycetemcomitans TaxID=714 RepID=Q8RQ55_AGGAC|nr:unknown [Aggregatibacter actinomycetemcomitans]
MMSALPKVFKSRNVPQVFKYLHKTYKIVVAKLILYTIMKHISRRDAAPKLIND